jgi:hypothetical protein
MGAFWMGGRVVLVLADVIVVDDDEWPGLVDTRAVSVLRIHGSFMVVPNCQTLGRMDVSISNVLLLCRSVSLADDDWREPRRRPHRIETLTEGDGLALCFLGPVYANGLV